MNTLLYLGAIAIVMFAQTRMQSAYHRYRKMESEYGYSGAAVARAILDANGLHNVKVQLAEGGSLSDHYNPMQQTVNLSPDIYYKSSIASIAVAAHEVGHAIQHKERYGAIGIRNAILPVANIASQLGWGVLFFGFMIGFTPLLKLGVVMLLTVMAFQLITLPIEFNASSRAIVQMRSLNIIAEQETADARSMLNAAAFTYVAAVINTIFQILRILLMMNRRERD